MFKTNRTALCCLAVTMTLLIVLCMLPVLVMAANTVSITTSTENCYDEATGMVTIAGTISDPAADVAILAVRSAAEVTNSEYLHDTTTFPDDEALDAKIIYMYQKNFETASTPGNFTFTFEPIAGVIGGFITVFVGGGDVDDIAFVSFSAQVAAPGIKAVTPWYKEDDLKIATFKANDEDASYSDVDTWFGKVDALKVNGTNVKDTATLADGVITVPDFTDAVTSIEITTVENEYTVATWTGNVAQEDRPTGTLLLKTTDLIGDKTLEYTITDSTPIGWKAKLAAKTNATVTINDVATTDFSIDGDTLSVEGFEVGLGNETKDLVLEIAITNYVTYTLPAITLTAPTKVDYDALAAPAVVYSQTDFYTDDPTWNDELSADEKWRLFGKASVTLPASGDNGTTITWTIDGEAASGTVELPRASYEEENPKLTYATVATIAKTGYKDMTKSFSLMVNQAGIESVDFTVEMNFANANIAKDATLTLLDETGENIIQTLVRTEDTQEFAASMLPGSYKMKIERPGYVTETIDVLVDEEASFTLPDMVAGDTTGDGTVDEADLTALQASFNKSASDAGYAVSCDYDANGIIDIYDYRMFHAGFSGALTTAPVAPSTPDISLRIDSDVYQNDVFTVHAVVADAAAFGGAKLALVYDSDKIVPCNADGTVEYTAWNDAIDATVVPQNDNNPIWHILPAAIAENGITYTIGAMPGSALQYETDAPLTIASFYFKAKADGDMGWALQDATTYFVSSGEDAVSITNSIDTFRVFATPVEPSVTNVAISGNWRENTTATVSYTFNNGRMDVGADTTTGDASTYVWKLDGTPIVGATEKTLDLTFDMVDKSLTVEVLAKIDRTPYPTATTAVASDAITVKTKADYKPTATIAPMEEILVGTTVEPTVTFDNTYAGADYTATEYKWYALETADAAIEGTPVATTKDVTFTVAQMNKYAVLVVTARATVAGEPLTATEEAKSAAVLIDGERAEWTVVNIRTDKALRINGPIRFSEDADFKAVSKVQDDTAITYSFAWYVVAAADRDAFEFNTATPVATTTEATYKPDNEAFAGKYLYLRITATDAYEVPSFYDVAFTSPIVPSIDFTVAMNFINVNVAKDATLTFLDETGDNTQTLKRTADTQNFTATAVSAGSYKLKIERPGYVTFTIDVTVDDTAYYELPAAIAGDTDGDGKVHADDYMSIVNNWRRVEAAEGTAFPKNYDFNADGYVHADDYMAVVNNWRYGV